MLDTKQAPPACIYLLGDHLDAILAAGEDLLATSLELAPPSAAGGVAELKMRQEALAAFLSRLRTLEAGVVARVLQARRRAEEMPKADAHVKPLVSLFLSGTTVLLDAVAEYGDPSGLAFNSGADGLHFLRTRGLVAPDAADLPIAGTLAADEDYLVVGRVRLGSLMDLVATFLDALDVRFSLYEADEVPGELERFIEVPVRAAPVLDSSATAEEARVKAKSLAAALEALYGPS
jgi:hypothetical protein